MISDPESTTSPEKQINSRNQNHYLMCSSQKIRSQIGYSRSSLCSKNQRLLAGQFLHSRAPISDLLSHKTWSMIFDPEHIARKTYQRSIFTAALSCTSTSRHWYRSFGNQTICRSQIVDSRSSLRQITARLQVSARPSSDTCGGQVDLVRFASSFLGIRFDGHWRTVGWMMWQQIRFSGSADLADSQIFVSSQITKQMRRKQFRKHLDRKTVFWLEHYRSIRQWRWALRCTWPKRTSWQDLLWINASWDSQCEMTGLFALFVVRSCNLKVAICDL
jgi:hypothetical protein